MHLPHLLHYLEERSDGHDRASNALLWSELALAMILFGSATPVSKIVTDAFPIFLASGMRMGIAALLLTPLIWKERHPIRQL